MVWATSNAGVFSSRKCYQTLETYGDTVLKLAGTILSYNYCMKYEKNPDERKMDQMRTNFITNLYFLRIGKRLKLQRYIRTIDPDLKTWSPPYSEQVNAIETLNCTGKHIADVVESIIGAHFMTNNLRRSMQLISDMRIMPLQQAQILDLFPDKDLTFELGEDIDCYGLSINDTVESIFRKYFSIHTHIAPEIRGRINQVIDQKKEAGQLGEIFFELLNEESFSSLGQRETELKLIEKLLPLEKVLNYEFKNKTILLEAFTHRSFKEYHGLSV